MKKILIVFGTRPEAIKMAPLVKEFKKHQTLFNTKVCVTAQHREMLDQVLDFFDISSDYDLNLMKPGQNLYGLTADIITNMKSVLEDFQPEYVFVHGDTTTTMAGSIAAFYSGAKVCHIEAGLRTYNKLSPFPEEINRQITGRVCDYHFAPTKTSKNNLLKENINEQSICVTGNTVIDALLDSLEVVTQKPSAFIRKLSQNFGNKEMILVTGHRRENHGKGFIQICEALKEIALDDPDRLIVYPVHLNPKVQEPVKRILKDITNILLIDPLAYQDFIWMMNRAKIIITDSGGIQEETTYLGIQCMTIRENTERPVTINIGTNQLVGTDIPNIKSAADGVLDGKVKKGGIPKLWDGKTAERIVSILMEKLN